MLLNFDGKIMINNNRLELLLKLQSINPHQNKAYISIFNN